MSEDNVMTYRGYSVATLYRRQKRAAPRPDAGRDRKARRRTKAQAR